jgi:hypothetical protein
MIFNIVGAGICGSMVAKEFDNKGLQYRIFDSNEQFASSKISENLFSPTWLKGLQYLDGSIKWLANNYDVETKKFKTNKSMQNVYHIPINKMLATNVLNKKVTKLTDSGLFCGNDFFEGINIVCAGFFCKQLLKIDSLNSLSGHGLLFEPNPNNLSLDEVMRHYRPFTHEKIIKWHDGRIWYGDSTAIVHDSYIKKQKQYIASTLKRASAIGLKGEYKIYFGARPFMNNANKKFGLYKKVNDNNYVLTGGWKDGLVIYPYLISKLMKDLKW